MQKTNKQKNWLLHSRPRSQWRVKISMFVQMIASELLNILLPNLILWGIVMSWSVIQKAVSKIRVTVRAHMIKIRQFLLYLLNCWSCGTKFGLIAHYHKPECLKKKLNCFVQGQGHCKMLEMYVNVYSDDIFPMNCWIFYYQMRYGDASSWARLSSKKTGFLFSRSRSQWKIIIIKIQLLIYLANCRSFCN